MASTFHSDENVGGGVLSSPQKNIGEGTLPSSSPIVDVAATVATATAEVQIEEGEIVVKGLFGSREKHRKNEGINFLWFFSL